MSEIPSENLLRDRLPPQSMEAERAVLGSMMRDRGVIGDVVNLLRADSFYSDAHQKIWQAVVELYDQGGPVDLVLVAETLQRKNQLEDIGRAVYLAELWDATPTAANAEYYARIVRDRAILRDLIHVAGEIGRDAQDQVQPADELLEATQRRILEVAQKGIVGQTTTLHEALGRAYDRIDARSVGDHHSISGLATGFLDLDEITAGLQNSELVIVAARPSVGKCLAYDSEIVLDDGSIASIEDIVRSRSARLFTLNDDWRLSRTTPSAYIDDGLKPVFRVTTRTGRQVETTACHPFRTLDGWQPLDELKPGDRIAVPRRLDVFGREPMRECEIKLLAYLIGDGCLTDTVPEFTNANPRLRDDFTRAVTEFGPLRVRKDERHDRTTTLSVSGDPDFIARGRPAFGQRLHEAIRSQGRSFTEIAKAIGTTPDSVAFWTRGECVPGQAMFDRVCAVLEVEAEELVPSGRSSISRNAKNPLTEWLIGLNLWGKGAKEKTVPACVFRLPRTQLALFLNRLFATDGWASASPQGGVQIGYCSVSEKLTRQVQHLLLRFGVIAALRRKPVAYRGTQRIAWQLEITHRDSLRAYIADIGMFGKEEGLQRVGSALDRRGTKPSRDLIPVAVWRLLEAAKGAESWASLARRAGLGSNTNIHVGKRAPSRHRLDTFAAVLRSEPLQELARSDVYWDEIVSIEPQGCKQVYDLTVEETHNFVANDICVHNTAFALGLIRNMIVQEKAPVFFVSLEQSSIELAERLLCAQAMVDSHKLRTGHLSGDDMQKLVEAGGVLRDAKLIIDDSPGQGMLRIAANARRLKLRDGIKVVVIDYLQLIEPENRRDPRQEQVAQISRRLKFLARELSIPVVALAQVNRASEDRQDHRPRLADLRESGCLSGDTLITLADTNRRVPIRELVGREGFAVRALDESSAQVKSAVVSRAFSTGIKPVFRMTTDSGRSIRATANHRFRTPDSWRRLDRLKTGDRIAVASAFVHPKRSRTNEADVCCWDTIASIVADGEDDVFDLTVPGPHNFVANSIIAHNSIEQDADTVMLLHRPDRYEPGQSEGLIEVIIAKQRNGPVGEITLAFVKQYMRFENHQRDVPFDS